MNACRECGKDFDSEQGVNRHVKVHKMSYREYITKWKYSGQIPRCKCGCGQEPSWNISLKDFAEYVHGHHTRGTVVSEETRLKIGKTNAIKMKQYYAVHPEKALEKSAHLRSGITDETYKKIKESLLETYGNMSAEKKQEFVDRTKRRWESGELKIAHIKATETFTQNIASGHYDFKERNDKLSQSITKKYQEGGFAWCKGQYTSSKTGKTYNYRSSWEKQYMELLDADSTVVGWEYEPQVILYDLEGKKRRYLPDFFVKYVDGITKIVEVKPASLAETKMNVAKRAAVLKYCKENKIEYEEWYPEHDTCTRV